MKLKEIVNNLELEFPKSFASENDNTGLQIGDLNQDINSILIALECTKPVIEFAQKNKIDLIITHHPLIFNKLSSVTSLNTCGETILKAIKNNISVYSIHTNADAIDGGLNDYLAATLDMKVLKPIFRSKNDEFVKLVTYIPSKNLESVRSKLLDSGIGHISNYSHCSFNTSGIGTFLPQEGTKPFIGEINKLEEVKETRFESIVPKKDINKTISLLKSVHPYEEVAFDIYPLLNNHSRSGIGRYCETKTLIKLSDFINFLPSKLNIDFIRYNGNPNKEISSVAICTGSGGSFLSKLTNIDLYISGDINYHQAIEAIEKDICFIDIGHDQEKIFIPFLEARLKKMNFKAKIYQYKNTLNPFIIKHFSKEQK